MQILAILAILILLAGLIFGAYALSAVLLPLLYGASYTPRDRGCGVFMLNGCPSALFVPPAPARKYIKSYQIFRSESNDKCFFIGEWAQHAAFAKYDIVVYNSHGRVIEVYKITEWRNGARQTAMHALPAQCSYVSLNLRLPAPACAPPAHTITAPFCALLVAASLVAAACATAAAYLIFWLVSLISGGGMLWHEALPALLCGTGCTVFGVCLLCGIMPLVAAYVRTKLKFGGHSHGA